MLPFLRPRKEQGVVMMKAGKSMEGASSEMEAPGHEMDEGLKSAAEDVLMAIEHKSSIDLAQALKDLFLIVDCMPHEEGPHEG